jgi:uncharacterized membrane protein YedE/YeeE
MERPLMAEEFCIPQSRDLDPRLLIGAVLFGIGWGLAGLCPGPAIAGLILGYWQSWVFVAAMIAGMGLYRLYADIAAGRRFRLAGGWK